MSVSRTEYVELLNAAILRGEAPAFRLAFPTTASVPGGSTLDFPNAPTPPTDEIKPSDEVP